MEKKNEVNFDKIFNQVLGKCIKILLYNIHLLIFKEMFALSFTSYSFIVNAALIRTKIKISLFEIAMFPIIEFKTK